jgi:hypothetical protein
MGEGARSPWEPTKNLIRTLSDRALWRTLGRLVAKCVATAIALAVAFVFGGFFAHVGDVSGSIPLAILVILGYAAALNAIRVGAETDHGEGALFVWITRVTFALLMAAAAIGLFAGMTANLLEHGHGTVHPAIHDGRYAATAYEHYLWHLADSIPVLKVPDTLHWKLEHRITDHTNGALTLGAKILIYAPLLAIGASLLARRPAQSPSS